MMKMTRAVAIAVVVVVATPLLVVSNFAQSENLKLAQVGIGRDQPRIEIGPGGVRIGPKKRPRCRTVTTTIERPDGRTITRRERRCDDDERIDR